MAGWNGQTDEQTDRWMEGMIDKQIDRYCTQADKQTNQPTGE